MSDLPKVSGVLPVGCGDRFFLVAAQSFLASTYDGELELILLDNSATSIEALIPDDPRVRYYACQRMPVGALRNLGTSYATGTIIVNLDEDDWSHPERVGEQVGRLLGTGKAVTGMHSIYYYETGNGTTYKYWYEPNRPHPPYACGSSMCFTKTWWESHKFVETGVEDLPFSTAALAAKQLDSIDGSQLLVARAHNDSTCYPTQLGKHRQFPAVPKSDLPPAFYAAIKQKVVAAKPKPKAKAATAPTQES
jgi:glycosyltransferase involved in cell wall biosynthesis